MATNITVKSRIRINGQEYASTDDMPPAIRQVYERAMAELKNGTPRNFSHLPATGISQVVSKITFNGQDFPSVDAMPPEIRKLYDGVMAEFDAERSAGTNAGSAQAQLPLGGGLSVSESSIAMNAARPESTTARLLIAGAVIAALLLVSFVLRR